VPRGAEASGGRGGDAAPPATTPGGMLIETFDARRGEGRSEARPEQANAGGAVEYL
jgi:hypothetical protein